MRNEPLIGVAILMIILSLTITLSVMVLRTSQSLTEAYNPTTIKAIIPLPQIPKFYISILNMIALGRYDNALLMLSYASQSAISQIPNTDYLNSEIESLINQLESIKGQINESMYYLESYNVSESRALASSSWAAPSTQQAP